jgi:hypothetical protein
MRSLVGLLCSMVLLLMAQPSAALGVTIGLLPAVTTDTEIVVRGIAPRGQVVAIALNGHVEARIIAGPDRDVYYARLTLQPGPNAITVQLEGTEVVEKASLFRITKSFNDLNGHRLQVDMEILATLGLTDGVGGGAYAPEENLTRAQFAKFVVSALGLMENAQRDGALLFTDRSAIADWAAPFVQTAVKHGLITGYEDNTFRPDRLVSRAEMAVIAHRGLKAKGKAKASSGKKAAFSDWHLLPDWARPGVEAAAEAGLVGDYLGASFDASKPATRAEAAAAVRRLYEAIE